MRKWPHVLWACLAIGAFTPFAGQSATPSAPPPKASTPAHIGGLLSRSQIWPDYRDRFVLPEGRIVDTANGGVSHSEGQGYGMLLAVAGGDRPTFDRILGWTQQNLLAHEGALPAWNTTDANDAADGDILIAWALAEAADLWRERKYLDQASAIAQEIADGLLERDARFGLLLKPGTRGYSESERPDGPVVNLSYWVLPAFERLRALAPAADWAGLASSELSLMEASKFGKQHLPSDWIALGGSAPAPADGFSPGFGYNSVRLPLYLFWSGDSAPGFMRNFSTAWERGAFATATSHDGQDRAASFIEPGYENILSLAKCAADGESYPSGFYSYTAQQNYYPASLSALALVAAAMRGGPCLDATAMDSLLNANANATTTDLAPTAVKTASIGDDAAKPLATPPARVVTAMAANATAMASPIDNVREDGDNPLANVAERATPGFLLLAIGGLAFAIYKRRKKAKALRLQNLYAVTESHSHVTPLATPRQLPINPYHGAPSPALLARQMENAAAASVEFGKTFGVVYFDLGPRPKNKRSRAAQTWDEDVEELVKRLNGVLRRTDHVARINDREIVACIGLLPGLTELTSIANRLRGIGQASAAFARAFEAPAGLALYPLGGYRGEELIESARAYRRNHVLASQPAPALIEKPKHRNSRAHNGGEGTAQYLPAPETPRRSKGAV